MIARNIKTTVVCLLVCLMCSNLVAQETKFYYLSVGSGAYESDPDNFRSASFASLPNLRAAETSAIIMERIFRERLNGRGVSRISGINRPLTKKDFFLSLHHVMKMIKDDAPAKATLVIYYSGHGSFDAATYSQVCIPGGFTTSIKKNVNAALDELIHDAEVMDSVNFNQPSTTEFSYLVMYDCCRSTETSFYLQVASDSISGRDRSLILFYEEMVKRVAGFVRKVKREGQGSYVYAAGAGKNVYTYPLPPKLGKKYLDDHGKETGTLCRRWVLALEEYRDGEDLSFAQLLHRLGDTSLDKQTPPCVVESYGDNISRAGIRLTR